MLIGIKSVYDRPDITDGKRVLVDRLWPRGIKKSTVNLDFWMKDVAPSTELRQWFSHDPKKWEKFKARYWKEISENKVFKELIALVEANDVTFLFSSKERRYNNAVALASFIKRGIKKEKPAAKKAFKS